MIYAVRTGNHDRLREMLGKPENASLTTGAGRTILHAAAEEGNLEAARIAIAAGVNVNTATKSGQTALHIAASYGRITDWEDPDLDRRDPCKRSRHRKPNLQVYSALVEIMKERNGRIPEDLGPLDTMPEENRWDILTAALDCFLNPAQLLEELNAHGIDVVQADPDLAETLLGNPRYLKMATFLIENGADINATDADNNNPLDNAIEHGKSEMVSLLLKHGARTNQPPEEERSLIESALQYGKLDVAKLLVQHGFRFNPDESNQMHAAAGLNRMSVIEWFLEQGADINQRDIEGRTVLMEAAYRGNTALMEWLLERGASIHPRDNSGNGLLHWAAGSAETIKKVLSLGLSPNDGNAEGRTPLHWAAQASDCEGLRTLVAAGADINARDNEGNSALHVIFFSDEFRPDVEFSTFHTLTLLGIDRGISNKEGKTAFDMAVEYQYPEEYLKLLNPDPAHARDPQSFIWLGQKEYSDFLPSALVSTEIDGALWPSSEHYFHAQKTQDLALRERMRTARTIGDAQCRLREVQKGLPPNWSTRCDEIMRYALLEKFNHHPELREKLLATDEKTLVSDSCCEWFWVERQGVPFSIIGHMLMSIREELKR